VSLVPLLTVVFDHTLVSETQVDRVGGAGLAFGFVGVAVVANPAPGAFDPTMLFGVGLVFLAAACFALGGVLTSPLPRTLPMVSRQAWVMLVGGLFLHAGSVVRGEPVTAAAWTPVVLGAFAYLVLASSVLGYLLYFELLDRVGPAELNLVNYLVPVLAALASWALLGRLLGPTAVTGFVVVFVGFALLKRDALRCVVRSARAVPDC
jgi:drug/metabolite transporter (DMT)-like permease